jgi:hypothetical protein
MSTRVVLLRNGEGLREGISIGTVLPMARKVTIINFSICTETQKDDIINIVT